MNSSAFSAPISRGSRCVPPAPGNDAQRHLGQGETRGRRGDAIVAGQRDLETAAHHGAVHGGDDGHVQRLERVEQQRGTRLRAADR